MTFVLVYNKFNFGIYDIATVIHYCRHMCVIWSWRIYDYLLGFIPSKVGMTDKGPHSNSTSPVEQSDRNSHNFWFPKAIKVNEDILESLSSLLSN